MIAWPRGGDGPEDSSPAVAVAIDRGSAWTKASVIGHAGGRWHVAAHVSQPSAWGEDELLAALVERLRPRVAPDVAASLEETLAAAPRLETGTVVPTPSLAIVQVPGAPPPDELRATAERAGWDVHVAGEQRGVSAAHRFAALRDLTADAWLVVAPAGRAAAAQDTARVLVAAAGTVEGARIVWAAPAAPGESVERTLLGADLRYVAYAPRRSRFVRGEHRSTERAQSTLSAALSSLLEDVSWAAEHPQSTASGLRRAVQALARTADLRILAVDVGAASSTWVMADATGSSGATSRTAAPVVGGLAASGVAAELGAMLPLEIDDARVGDVVRTIAARPATLPETGDELAVVAAWVRHALGELLESVRPLAGVDLLVGTGRVIAGAPTPAAAAELLVEGVRPLGITQLALDTAGILPPLGALEGERLSEALAALSTDLLTPLGTAVVVSGATPGAQALRVRITREGDVADTITVRYGQVEIVPLATGESAELDIELERGISIGTQRALRRVRARVAGGAVGLILDARDTPIAVPRRADDRRIVLAEWHDRFAREPQRRDPVP